ncbi:hypothetical protein [Enterobacter sp. C4G1]|uniref:hypothetical protein n=1 Tax=Enterobacter sp. C4G1 TaxID=3458724 RepID=UPI004068DCA7
MSSNWWNYKDQAKPDRSGLPVWPTIVVFVVAIAIGFLIRALTWPDNKHVNGAFIADAILIPSLLVMTLASFMLMVASVDRHYDETRLAIKKRRDEVLKRYARKKMVIAGWHTLTPMKDDPALAMLKLEGEFPLAPKTPLKLPREDSFEFTTNEMIFMPLVAPLVDKLKTYYRQFEAVVWVNGGDESCAGDLQRTLERLGVKPGKVEYLAECPGYVQVDSWIDSARDYVFNRLLVIVDKQDDENESKAMESATAILLTNAYTRTEGEAPVYLYRPIVGIIDAEKAVPVYLFAESVSAPKVLWYTGLSRTQKYPLLKVLDEHQLAATRLGAEDSFGDKSAGYQWLLVALAADAISYAQGDQLVAAPEKNRMNIISLSSRLSPDPVSDWWVDYLSPWQYGMLLGLFFGFSLLLAISYLNKPDPLSGFCTLAVILGPFFIITGLGILLTISFSNKAYDDMRA